MDRFSLTLIAASTILVSACGANASSGGTHAKATLPPAEVVAHSKDQLNIAVRYLAFKDAQGKAAAEEGKVRTMIDYMNKIWSQCSIGFVLESYQAVTPDSVGAQYSPANYSELDEMRVHSQTANDLEIIGTGPWNRSGDLGASGSNCYSSFPGDDAQGIVCELAQAASPTLMAHEVGHWINLRHTEDPSSDAVDDTTAANVEYNLMNHLVAPENDRLTDGQCVRARTAIAESRLATVVQ